jgi:hypothetical protein
MRTSIGYPRRLRTKNIDGRKMGNSIVKDQSGIVSVDTDLVKKKASL